ncbi:2-dehydropantoate 2-reductase N-terminal domain-containing protein [Paraburkholderia aromaticivorans]|uniref:2-dehydropantoate 2-reductase N-terminal domain-containing protein n=1 Tax=Paraburkholderia aromaticivorans TaxID=2026199 RepID=UPI003D666576
MQEQLAPTSAALALAGHDVTFGVRDTSRSAIESAGIWLSGPRGNFQVRSVNHTERPEHVTDADIVMATLKKPAFSPTACR